MSNAGSTQIIDRDSEPEPQVVTIAGYELQSRLGVGGYGEVWKAIGPGGLPKAVKILFGQMDGPQADAELKSLERMRDLRHPFLLSIERIEVVDSRLVVVTELADACLEDRFQSLRSEGQRGVPREELLGYLRDAADALDFMLEEHGLQHLDIKPENLLLQGRHVKVGDFGLAKDVSVTNMSLVGGFTPLYAPPEIFEGQPSRSSDQYSLAIVYQTMLTGVPPFAGRTAAQLTAQHLRSTPDLSSLQPVDRPVIARALSKNPNARFPSCRQFVDELAKRRNSRVRSPGRSTSTISPSTTERVDADAVAVACDLKLQETVPLRPVEVPVETTFRPTLFVGVGGLGGQVLLAVREQFADRFGAAAIPAFPMLYLDSDRNAVSASRQTRDTVGLEETELLTIPLRSAADYRKDSEMDLEWLSRRWLFNLPRSGEIEGIRPLGRLALMDHRRPVVKRIREAVATALSEEAVVATAAAAGFELLPKTLDVVVVGSTSGGTSSGAVLDTAYLVREAVSEMELESLSVVGMLIHATSSQRDLGDIQEANTISCLQELNHYSRPGLGHEPPFDHAYVVHLGDSLPGHEFGSRVQNVADYVFASAATPTRGIVEKWRDLETTRGLSTNTVRTFGVASVDESVYQMVNREARSLCYALVQKWACATGADETDRGTTRTMLVRARLAEAPLSEHVMGILRGDVGRRIESYAHDRWREITQRVDTLPSCSDLFDKLESSFADGSDDRVAAVLSAVMESLPESPASAKRLVADHISCRLDQPGRIGNAAATAALIVDELQRSAGASEQLLSEIDRSFSELRVTARREQQTPEEVESRCLQYCIVRFYKAIYSFFVRYTRDVLASAREAGAAVTTLRSSLPVFANGFVASGTVPGSQPEPLIEALDNQLQINDSFHLADLASGESGDHLRETLLREAEAFMLAHASGVSADSGRWQRAFPESARPELSNIGGGRRVLAVLPTSAPLEQWREKLQATFGDCLTLRTEQTNRMTVICEVEAVSVDTVLTNFRHKNPRLADVAGRVHTRVDIAW